MCKIIEKIIIREPGTQLKNKEQVINLRKLLADIIKCDPSNIDFRYYDDKKIDQQFNDGL